MRNIIQLLPDAIANQIAAGEVVQRPASVVKELLENAIDAGADRVDLMIKNAGKNLIMVTDNGAGMSASDARMAFERHATSKIREQDDLFRIQTLGFRGEALASIAAVAQVKLRTRLPEAELGIELEVEASKVKRHEAWAGPSGSTFMVRNLFYNVPARRNFLKSNPVETRHIINEFIRVALAHPEVYFSLLNNDTPVYELPIQSLEDRIVALVNQDLKGELIEVEESAGYATFHGFIGSPAFHRKSRGDQYFFVNGRYIRSNYLNHAITQAFSEYIPEDSHPFYCIFLGIDPVHVDINIHPTKTEVKFDDERTLYQLLQSVIKKGLADYHQTPEFDFEDPGLKEAIYGKPQQPPSAPATVGSSSRSSRPQNFQPREKVSRKDWENLYRPQSEPDTPSSPRSVPDREKQLSLVEPNKSLPTFREDTFVAQFQKRYILSQFGDDMIIVEQQQAHQRVLFERMLASQEGRQVASQQLLFPQTLEFAPADYVLLQEIDDSLQQMGFEVKEFGKNTLIVYGAPTEVATTRIRDIFEQLLKELDQTGGVEGRVGRGRAIAKAVAQRCAISPGTPMSQTEMRQLLTDLFRCQAPHQGPGGRPIIKKITEIELEEYFK